MLVNVTFGKSLPVRHDAGSSVNISLAITTPRARTKRELRQQLP
jgi:hypothetical protein